MAPIFTEQLASSPSKSEKKHKKDKPSKSEKKRTREEDAAADGERKHKKSKSITDLEVQSPDGLHEEKKKKKKSKKREEEAGEDVAVEANGRKEKKHKKKHRDAEASSVADDNGEAPEAEKERKKSKKKKESASGAEPADEGERKKKKKSKKHHAVAEDATASTAIDAANDAMDVDEAPAVVSPSKPEKSSKSSHVYQPADIPANPRFPFFTQTVSLYEPLFPIGWSQPVTSAQNQHLKHLQNRYVPSLRGVLLDYRNVSFGEQPGRAGAATDDEDLALVMSKGESAVGFGWVTADVDLFVPSRGAWMEGSVNIQTEGHIGLVCFGQFNASIEARRMPAEWKWVPNESNDVSVFDESASLVTADEHGVVRQVHSTGYWTDGDGVKVKGKIRFRIRNFDVGVSGDTSYLSLEGTMLDRNAERALVKEEARMVQARREKKGSAAGGYRHERKRIPDFAMTRFEVEEEEKPSGQNEEEAREILRQPDDDEVPAENEEEE